MAYKKHEWKARQGTGLNKFRDQDGKLYEFTSAPDSVSQPGTPFSADWMNEMEEGIAAAGITYLTSTAASGATSISITANAPETVAAGDHFRIYFPNQIGAGATLNIGNTGAKPIINNYTASAIVQSDIPADYTADIMYDGVDYVLLNADRFTPKNPNLLQFVSGIISTLGGETIGPHTKIEAGTYIGNDSKSRTLQLSFTPKIFIVTKQFRPLNSLGATSNANALMVLLNGGGYSVYTMQNFADDRYAEFYYGLLGNVVLSENSVSWEVISSKTYVINDDGTITDNDSGYYYNDYIVAMNARFNNTYPEQYGTYNYVAIG